MGNVLTLVSLGGYCSCVLGMGPIPAPQVLRIGKGARACRANLGESERTPYYSAATYGDAMATTRKVLYGVPRSGLHSPVR